MKNLAQITQQITNEYVSLHSYVIPTEKISLTDNGLLSTGRNEFPLTLDVIDQFAGIAEIPKQFFRELEPDLRPVIFNRRFQARVANRRIGRDLRINLNQDKQIIGFDDPKLLRISPVKLMDVFNSSLPKNLPAKEIMVGQIDLSSRIMHVSCFSPEKKIEPRPGDIINGGVDIIHHTSGDTGTQINCYLRRLICQNGAVAHICSENKTLRARRLNNGSFDENDMLMQIQRLLTQAWVQVNEKLDAVRSLIEKKRISLDFLRQERTKFSLNNRMLAAIRLAIKEDEFGPTDTQFDIFNAISRVATHDDALSFRQRRTLGRMAGEFSQQDVHKCDNCGSWIIQQN